MRRVILFALLPLSLPTVLLLFLACVAGLHLLRVLVTLLQGERPDGFSGGGAMVFWQRPSPGLVAHEGTHLEDERAHGLRYYVTYAWDLVTKGYYDVRWERRARAEQERVSRGGT